MEQTTNTHDVDTRCAVRLRALPRHRLPVRTVRWLEERPRDVCGRYRSPVTLPGYRQGVKPANTGKRYPADPLTAAEMMRLLDAIDRAGDRKARRLAERNRALVVVLWRSGLRIFEALALQPGDLDAERGTVFVRNGKGGKAAVCGMDPWAFEQIEPWVAMRGELPVGPLFCVIEGPTTGGRMRSAYVRTWLRRLGLEAGIAKRVHPHGFRHALACELAREGVPVPHISRQLRHSNVGTTATYLQGLAPQETLNLIAARTAPGGTS